MSTRQPRPSSRIVQAAISAVLLFSLCLHAAADAGGGVDATRTRPLRELLGLGVKFSQGQPQADLATLVDLQVRWVRDCVPWPELEPQPGVYQAFPPAFQQRLDFYRAHDIGVVFLLVDENRVAYPPSKEQPLRAIDPAAFGRYAAAVARKLKAAGVRFVFDVWNEPHNFSVRNLVGGNWNGAPPSPWVQHYVRMVQAAVEQVKAVDPQIRLMSDDDMWVLHYWFLEAGLPKRLDGFSIHPYAVAVPEVTAISHDTEWMKPFTAVDLDRSFASAVRRLRARGQEKLGRDPGVWITEWGWPAAGDGPFGPMSEDLVAAFLPRAYLAADLAGVEVLCWFSAFDGPDGPMGLLTSDGRRRPSYRAYRTLAQQLGDHSLEAQLLGHDHPTSGAQALLYRGAHDRRLALWTVDGKREQVRLVGALQGATAVDVFGRWVAPELDATGTPSIAFGRAPVYLAGLRERPARLELVASTAN